MQWDRLRGKRSALQNTNRGGRIWLGEQTLFSVLDWNKLAMEANAGKSFQM